MIGSSSFFVEILGISIPTIMFVVGVVSFCMALGKRDMRRVFSLAFMVAFCGLLVFIMGTRFYNQVQSREFLRTLQNNQIAEIDVGGTRITDPVQIRNIVTALSQIDWFSMNHGGTGKQLHFGITLGSGLRHTFGVAYYTREPGAVISFHRGGWHDGYAFARDLPKALAAAGSPLPEKP